MYFRFMFAHFCVHFFFFSFQNNAPSSPGPPFSLLGILAFSLICMRAVLRSALIVRRGHLGIKKCQSTELSNHPKVKIPSQRHSFSTVPSSSQSTNHYYFILRLSLESVKKLYYAKVVVGWLVWFLFGLFWSLLMFTTPFLFLFPFRFPFPF